MNQQKPIAIFGLGSWGSALGHLLQENGHSLIFWHHLPETLQDFFHEGKFTAFPDMVMDLDRLTISTDFNEVLTKSDILITALPAQIYASFWPQLTPHLHERHCIINVSKGIHIETGKFIFQLFQESLKTEKLAQYATLSGPSFAEEVVAHQPTVVTVATPQEKLARRIQDTFCNSWFRVYRNPDLLGVEFSGAAKNVIAIASGVLAGQGLGMNTRAALITRGLKEMTRLGQILGASQETFQGLTGIGDLMLTCMSNQSRNFSFGKLLGEGVSPDTAQNQIGHIVEGAFTVKALMKLAKENQVELPIAYEVHEIVFNNKTAKQAIFDLMTRDLKAE